MPASPIRAAVNQSLAVTPNGVKLEGIRIYMYPDGHGNVQVPAIDFDYPFGDPFQCMKVLSDLTRSMFKEARRLHYTVPNDRVHLTDEQYRDSAIDLHNDDPSKSVEEWVQHLRSVREAMFAR